MKRKIKEIVNEILNSRKFIAIIGIILILKTIFFYYNTVNKIEMKTLGGIIAFIVTLMCFINVLTNKARITLVLIIDILISILLFSDNLYYSYSSNMISIQQISNLQYSEEIINTIPNLAKINQIVYFIDLISILVLFSIKIVQVEKLEKYDKKPQITSLALLILGVLLFVSVEIRYIQKGTEKSYNKDEQIIDATVYGYHISDIINFFNMKNNAEYTSYEEMISKYNNLKEEYSKKYGQIKHDYKNILENKNIIILQLESVQEFVAHKTINGKEITPNLNKFLDENIELTNMHMQSFSSTADAEHSTLTSTYPLENGMSYSKYFSNTYDNLFDIFYDKNYYTSYMHGNVGTFWNRQNVYSRLNIQDLNFIEEFEDTSEMISGYLADELLYRQAVEKIKKYQNPYISFIVAASSHTGFDLPGIQNKDEKINIDVGEYKYTYFGNYLEAVNYADYAFGIFIDELKKLGLYEDTAIIVFGDHNGVGMYDEEFVRFLKQNDPDTNEIDIALAYTRVLCGMKIPGAESNLKIDKVTNKLDLKPTIAYLSNTDEGFSLGTNIFASKDFVCLNNERIIKQDYYYNREWYKVENGELVDFDKIEEKEKQKLESYYNYMKRELDISFSVNINDLLKARD